MSNESILERIIEACERFNAGQITTTELKAEIESLAESLEVIPQREVASAVKQFVKELWWGEHLLWEDEKDKDGWANVALAISNLRESIAAQLSRNGVNPPAPNPDTPSESNRRTT
jgi:hypothetical protein